MSMNRRILEACVNQTNFNRARWCKAP